MPKELKCWENLAKAYIERGKNHEAVEAYLLGRKHFKHKDEVKTAIKLLYKAFDLRQWDYDITFDLAKAYLYRGAAYADGGDKSKAIDDLEKCISLSTDAVITERANSLLKKKM